MKKSTKISLASLAAIVLCASAVLVSKMVFAAGTATLSLTPASGTFSQGTTLNVDIYEDSGSDTVNAVQANFSYPTSMLNYTGVTNSSGFTVEAQSSASGGVIRIARGATTPVSGNQLVATVHFSIIAGGTANLTFGTTTGSAVVRSTDNNAETLTTNDASYNLISPATISLSPSTKSLNKGDTLAISIFENSGGTAVNAVQADLNYPASLLTFVSIDPASSSAFPVDAQATGGSGTVKIGRGTTSPVTGNQLVGVVHFTAAAAGTAAVSFNNSTTAVIRSSDNGPEALTETGGSYTISAPSTGGTGSGGGTTTKPPATKPKATTTTPTTTNKGSTPAPAAQAASQPPVTTNFDTVAPEITNISVINLSVKSATVTWHTSEPSTSEVDYGLNTNYVLNVTDSTLTKDHSVALRKQDLVGHKTYHFQIKSVDADGNLAFSKDLTFKTEPASSKSGVSNFWSAFAAVLIVGAIAYVGWTYLIKMRGQTPPGSPPAAGPAGGSANVSGGAVIKPGTAPKAAKITPAGNVPEDAIILNPPPAQNASGQAAPSSLIKPNTPK